MDKFFVPYSDGAPLALNIKGHKVLIVTTDSEDMVEDLDALGGNEVLEIELPDGEVDYSQVLADLAARINGGVVLAPPGVTPTAMIHDLEAELPWIH